MSASDTATPVGDGGAVTFPDEAPVAAPYSNYSRTVRIKNCSVGTACGSISHAELRRVTVTVTYRPITGVGAAASAVDKSVVLTMYVSQR